jgi:pimeloyl-ACP methyl ester carboxylesterase
MSGAGVETAGPLETAGPVETAGPLAGSSVHQPVGGPELRGVLLVHGAWYTASSWLGVARRLRELGVPVGVAELHRGSLAADVEAATSALDEMDTAGPVIACGHSYGGTVITGLDPARVAHLVYLAGPMPDVGETSLGLLASEPTGLVAALRERAAGTTEIDPDLAGDLLFSQLDADQRAFHVKTLVSQEMAAGHEELARVAWRTRPSTYVVCSEDRGVSPVLQRRLSERATNVVTLCSDHFVFLSHEDDTVELLHRLATSRTS